jgi:hypothetical protein
MAPTDIAACAAAVSGAHQAPWMNSTGNFSDALMYEAPEIGTLTRTISECQRPLLFRFRASLHMISAQISLQI